MYGLRATLGDEVAEVGRFVETLAEVVAARLESTTASVAVALSEARLQLAAVNWPIEGRALHLPERAHTRAGQGSS